MTPIVASNLGGRIAYGGFEFGGSASTPPTYRLTGTPVRDESGGQITHVKYLLEVSAIVHADSETEMGEELERVRGQLSRPGGELALSGLGLGEWAIGGAAGERELLYGVMPKVVSLAPLGGSLAWQLTWECEFCLREDASRLGESWLSLNYAASEAIDERGCVTRTLRGYVQVIPAAAGGPRSVDAVRDRLRLIVPPGFRRVRSEWTPSADGLRISFEVVDQQLAGEPLPAGIVAADVDFQVEHAGGPRLFARLAGTLETAEGAGRGLAAAHFFRLAAEKMRGLSRASGRESGLVVPARIVVRHKLFSRQTYLAIELYAVRSLADFLQAGGVWQTAGKDERAWRASLQRVWSNRGLGRRRSASGPEVLIDLVERPVDRAVLGGELAAADDGAEAPRSGERLLPATLAPNVTPRRSWLEYQVRLTISRSEHVSVHTLAEGVQRAGGGSATSASEAAGGIGAAFRSRAGGRLSVREVHGGPTQRVVLGGHALRLKYPPQPPRLARLGGQRPVELARSEEHEEVTTFCGVSVWGLRWSITYDVEGYLSGVELPQPPE